MKKFLFMSITALVFTFTTVLPVIQKHELPDGTIHYYDEDRDMSVYQFESGEYIASYPGVTNLRGEEAMRFFNRLKQEYESRKAVKAAKAWSRKLGEGLSITPKESIRVKQLVPLLLTQHSSKQPDKFNK